MKRRKVSKEDIIKKQERLAAIKQEEIERKGRIFRGWLGKALKIIAFISLLSSILILVDAHMEGQWNKYSIHRATKEQYDIIKGSGTIVPTTYYHVYLNEIESFDIYIYKYDYYVADEVGEVEIKQTPILGVPQEFRIIHPEKKSKRNSSLIH